jgi:tetratricopeptide (TPR) repeat protein
MKALQNSTKITVLLLIAAFTGSVLALHQVDRVRGKQATLEEILYVPSGKALKRLSLGYSGLLADIYWTRAVQYFGQKHHDEDLHYDLLYPLLDITTDLDPHLIIAYEFGSIFLSQRIPDGAGQPEKAVALVEKGIRANPRYWRLYFTLGYIHYFDRKDYKAAQEAFQKGSEIPGAYSWMKVMAATMAQRAGEISLAKEIWSRLYESTQDEMIKENAKQHLVALKVEQEIAELEHRVELFRQRNGRLPLSWQDMMQAGFLPGTPIDPIDKPLKLMPDGTIQVADPDKLPFITKGLPPGWKKSTKRH